MSRQASRLLSIVLCLLLSALSACDGAAPAREPYEVGSVVAARTKVDAKGPEASVSLPSGTLNIRSGKPTPRLDAVDTSDNQAVDAPAGGVFLPVRWAYRTQNREQLQAVFGSPLPITASLVADGKQYPLPPPRTDAAGVGSMDFYVLLARKPKTLKVDVQYGTATQTVNLETGRVARRQGLLLQGVDDFNPDRQRACPSERWAYVAEKVYITFWCTRTDVLVTPFLDGKFAKKGYAFAVLELTSNLANYVVIDGSGGQALYSGRSRTDRTTLGGRRPVKVLGREQNLGANSAWLAWRVRLDEKGHPMVPDTLHFERVYDLELNRLRGDMSADRRMKFTLEGDMPVSR